MDSKLSELLKSSRHRTANRVKKFLLDNTNIDLDIKDKNGYAALHLACLSGNLATVKILVENKAKLDFPDDRGNSPLHFAARLSEN